MDRLYDLAEVLRSKNAGPLYITLDLLFADEGTYRRVAGSEALTPGAVAALYGVEAEEVRIIQFDAARAIKITIPRTGPTSGAPGDRDVYGAQQHGPLLGLMIP
ncbi:MAG: DUF4387 domain-containing protein [Candidatus Tectomicrobia bacterium]|uniref:DUF4387 domain-containing protein n=1 Tax=Tectimicrobiota bacterium TaxID=2528274 RepID=A0A932HWI6_UNCTE|nr:DUF4387 domain-containing protein [Candidatus Tectomicrobia bacterium]